MSFDLDRSYWDDRRADKLKGLSQAECLEKVSGLSPEGEPYWDEMSLIIPMKYGDLYLKLPTDAISPYSVSFFCEDTEDVISIGEWSSQGSVEPALEGMISFLSEWSLYIFQGGELWKFLRDWEPS